MPAERIAFADSLRGLAALLIMLALYVVTFNHLKGSNLQFWTLAEEPFPRLARAIYLWLPGIDYLTVGIALFFLISGFIIPRSLERYGTNFRGSLAFLAARAFRLWPAYALGVVATILVLVIVGQKTGHHAHFKIRDVIWQFTLYRDWSGTAEILALGWSLEVLAKFYLFCIFFGWAVLRRPVLLFFIVLVIADMAGPIKYPSQDFALSNLLFATRYFPIILVGTAAFHHMRGRLPDFGVIAAAALALFVFYGAESPTTVCNYALAITIFLLAYANRLWFKSNGPLQFLGFLSYPLALLHTSIGFVGLRLMIGKGVPSAIALAVQICVSIALAYLIRRFIEKPAHAYGRSLARTLIGKQSLPAEASSFATA